MFSHAKSCLESNMLDGKALYFGVVSFIDSKWSILHLPIHLRIMQNEP
jgi:hypothetical protein